MKKILLIIFIILLSKLYVFAGLTAPYFGVNGYFQGTSYFSFNENNDLKGCPQFIPTFGFDLKLGKEVFFIGSFNFINILSNQQPFNSVISVCAGVGWYLFDKRIDGKGQSLTMNISAIRNAYTGGLNYIAVQYGIQARASYYYNVMRNFAFMVAPYFNAHLGNLTRFGTLTYDSSHFYTTEDIKSTGLGLDYGLIIGIAF